MPMAAVPARRGHVATVVYVQKRGEGILISLPYPIILCYNVLWFNEPAIKYCEAIRKERKQMELHAATAPIIISEYNAKIYTLNTVELGDEAHFQNNYKRLSHARQSKIDSYHFATDKRLSLAAGMYP